MTRHYSKNSKNTIISFWDNDFWPKTFLISYPSLENSTTHITIVEGFNSHGAPWCPTGTSEANSKRLRGCEKFKLPVWRGCSTAHQKGRPVDSSGKKQAKLHKFTRLFAQLHFPCPTLQHSFNVHTFINHQEISTTFQLLHCTWNLIMRLTFWLYLFRITWGIFQSFLLNIN